MGEELKDPNTRERDIRRLAEASRGAFEALAKADPNAPDLPIVRAGIILEAKLRGADMDTVRVPRAALQIFVENATLLVARALRQRRIEEAAREEENLRELQKQASRLLHESKRDVVIVRLDGIEIERLDVTGLPEKEVARQVRDVQLRYADDARRRRGRT